MKNQFLGILAISVLLIACNSEPEETTAAPISEQSLRFEIYDSLVVDYLGNVSLMDISPDGKSFLLIDQNTDTILVADATGEILFTYKRQGEGPENYQESRMGVGKFLSSDQFLIPTVGGLYHYQNDGGLVRNLKPDFQGSVNLLIPASEAHFVIGNRAFLHLPGRVDDEVQDMEFQQNATLLEVVDLEKGTFEGKVLFPKSSRFSTLDKPVNFIDFYPNLTASTDSIFISFRNEPKIFGYAADQLDSVPKTMVIPLPGFIENTSPKDSENGGFDMRRFFYGTVSKITYLENGYFLVNYLRGLSDDVAGEIMAEAGTDFSKLFKLGGEKNEGGTVLFDGKSISPIIETIESLGNINKVISRNEIWFSLNFEKAENDYSIIYKTRLVEK